MDKNTYCIIMAGGVGSRFWPLSKSSTPKQFLDILGTGKSLIRQTFERFLPLCPVENFLVVTSNEYKSKVLEQVPELTEDQVLLEPFRRNTAPCIAYANAWIRSRNKDANIVVTPADHLILNEIKFIDSIKKGVEFVDNQDVLLTLGIKPHRPETGYGYIQVGDENNTEFKNFSKVKTFTEKPDLELAKVFFESGEFFWNSGIFIWSLSSIDQAFSDHLQDVHKLFAKLDKKIGAENETEIINTTYAECKNISIDYGVMEKATNVYVQTVDFGWSDLGTWSSLYEYSPQDKNDNAVICGKVLLYDTQNSIINVPKNKVAVIQGLNDYIVVDSSDAILICPKDNEQQIRQFTTDIKTEFGDSSL
ncbi:mannose-1-phosphate guanylyltransferase [Natronoflexus pectinivorans]|uniref:mannose-1-phosphate guanylyltransferase n=1 Tax=Natronoflexus pectinivorans TaxID=682526 RepID=A0A4R2GJI1_9BACT|nr:mannose-1-phosphate guanylyltransferase [Natronoflexus pectinivorans]TCO08204.1 mannose-1-phosphate guanylyltransferase [Natronoflexus pectinivorans]